MTRSCPSLRLAVVLVLFGTTPGCFLPTNGKPEETREYDLLPEGSSAAHSLAPHAAEPGDPPETLEVEPFSVSEALERDGLVWRRGEVEAGSYAQHRWARPPRQAVRDLVAASLATAVAPLSVATEPAAASPDLVLRAHLARCEEVDRGERWAGLVELRVVLARRDGHELLRRTYSGEEPAGARNPEAVVEALRRVVARLADELARDTAAALARPGAPTDRP